MVEAKARELFHGKEGYNCAQAVAKSLEAHCAADQAMLDNLSGCGGGRAEGGLCGALHAAKLIMKSAKAAKELEACFHENAGAATCRQIKELKKLTCHDCVGLAARLAHERLGKQ